MRLAARGTVAMAYFINMLIDVVCNTATHATTLKHFSLLFVEMLLHLYLFLLTSILEALIPNYISKEEQINLIR